MIYFHAIFTHNLRIILRIQYARRVPIQLYERGHILMAYYVYMQEPCQRAVLRIMVRILHTHHGTCIAREEHGMNLACEESWHQSCKGERTGTQRAYMQELGQSGFGTPKHIQLQGVPIFTSTNKIFPNIFTVTQNNTPKSLEKGFKKNFYIFLQYFCT